MKGWTENDVDLAIANVKSAAAKRHAAGDASPVKDMLCALKAGRRFIIKHRNSPSESKSQQNLIKWWKKEACVKWGIPECLLFAVPNQGLRNRANASRMKAEGMRAGCPDLFLLVARKEWHGLAIEMKSATGKVTVNQSAFLFELNEEGYSTAVCFSTDEAIAFITHYLNED